MSLHVCVLIKFERYIIQLVSVPVHPGFGGSLPLPRVMYVCSRRLHLALKIQEILLRQRASLFSRRLLSQGGRPRKRIKGLSVLYGSVLINSSAIFTDASTGIVPAAYTVK